MTSGLASSSTHFSAEAIERNDLLTSPACPFALPPADDLAFLLIQQMATTAHKDINFDPETGRLTGVTVRDAARRTRLADVLSGFSASVTNWVQATFPTYASGLSRDRVTLRTEEEATRSLRLTARNDLLHIDNFSTRPTYGRRILRVFTNINLAEPHVWATSEKFPALLTRFATTNRVPKRTLEEWASASPRMLRMFGGSKRRRSPYDLLMSRLHHCLKHDSSFQATATRKVWTFPPGSTWALFTDGLANAQLRGSFALEHSFFVPQECLVNPLSSPVSVLSEGRWKASGRKVG